MSKLGKGISFITTFTVICWRIVTKNCNYSVYAVNNILQVNVMYDLYRSVQES